MAFAHPQGEEESAVKAARIHTFGLPEVVVVEDVTVPSPGPGEVLVRVMAAGVAPWDALIREGKSKVSPQPPAGGPPFAARKGWGFSHLISELHKAKLNSKTPLLLRKDMPLARSRNRTNTKLLRVSS